MERHRAGGGPGRRAPAPAATLLALQGLEFLLQILYDALDRLVAYDHALRVLGDDPNELVRAGLQAERHPAHRPLRRVDVDIEEWQILARLTRDGDILPGCRRADRDRV